VFNYAAVVIILLLLLAVFNIYAILQLYHLETLQIFDASNIREFI